LRYGTDDAAIIEQEGSRAGRTLIESENVTHECSFLENS
jgi:hypothetical protein